MKRIAGFWLLITLTSTLIAQVVEENQQGKHVIEFRDGIYATFLMVKYNRPIPPSWVETDMEIVDPSFFECITKEDEIVFYDDNGVKRVLKTCDIWGYCKKGDLYINVGAKFHKISFVGRISHFAASETTYTPIAYEREPFFGRTRYREPKIITAENKEYLVDLENNNVWEFDMERLELVLQNDSQLWDEFNSLRKRKKKQMKYIFINRYNQKYPLNISSY